MKNLCQTLGQIFMPEGQEEENVLCKAPEWGFLMVLNLRMLNIRIVVMRNFNPILASTVPILIQDFKKIG